MSSVSYAGRSVEPRPCIFSNCFNHGGTGKDHSEGVMVINSVGNPNCLTEFIWQYSVSQKKVIRLTPTSVRKLLNKRL